MGAGDLEIGKMTLICGINFEVCERVCFLCLCWGWGLKVCTGWGRGIAMSMTTSGALRRRDHTVESGTVNEIKKILLLKIG